MFTLERKSSRITPSKTLMRWQRSVNAFIHLWPLIKISKVHIMEFVISKFNQLNTYVVKRFSATGNCKIVFRLWEVKSLKVKSLSKKSPIITDNKIFIGKLLLIQIHMHPLTLSYVVDIHPLEIFTIKAWKNTNLRKYR